MSTRQMEDWFSTRKWRVFTEATGEGSVIDRKSGDPVRVMFREGRFTIEQPFAFHSPIGNTGRRGVVLQEVDKDGKDLPGSLQAFGESVVAKAREVYHAVS